MVPSARQCQPIRNTSNALPPSSTSTASKPPPIHRWASSSTVASILQSIPKSNHPRPRLSPLQAHGAGCHLNTKEELNQLMESQSSGERSTTLTKQTPLARVATCTHKSSPPTRDAQGPLHNERRRQTPTSHGSPMGVSHLQH